MTTPTQPPAPEEQRSCRRCGRPVDGPGACCWTERGMATCDRRAIDRILARLEALEAALAPPPGEAARTDRDFVAANLSEVEALIREATPADFASVWTLESRREELRAELDALEAALAASERGREETT